MQRYIYKHVFIVTQKMATSHGHGSELKGKGATEHTNGVLRRPCGCLNLNVPAAGAKMSMCMLIMIS